MAFTRGYSTQPSFVASMLLGGVIFSIVLLAELPGGNLINLAVSGTFVACVLAVTFLGNRALWFGREVGLLVAWLAFSTLPSFFAPDVETAFFKALTMLQLVALVFCVQQVMVWQKSVAFLLMLYGVAVAMAYGVTFTELSISQVADTELREGGERVASTLVNENKFGAACVMGLSLCLLSAAVGGARWLQLLWAIVVPLLMFAAMNSGSRTALLGAVLVLAGSAWAFKVWRGAFLTRAIVTAPVFAVVGAVLFIVAQSNPIVAERIEQTFDAEGAIVTRVSEFFTFLATGDSRAESGESIDSRTDMIGEGIAILSDNPVIGVGLDNFRHVSEAGTYSHSNPIEVSVSTGLVGLLLYYSIYALIGWRALVLNVRSRGHAVPRMVLVAMAGYSLMDLTHISYYEKTSWLFLALLTATLEIFSRGLAQQQGARGKRRRRRRRRTLATEAESPEVFEDLDELDDVLGEAVSSDPPDQELGSRPAA